MQWGRRGPERAGAGARVQEQRSGVWSRPSRSARGWGSRPRPPPRVGCGTGAGGGSSGQVPGVGPPPRAGVQDHPGRGARISAPSRGQHHGAAHPSTHTGPLA